MGGFFISGKSISRVLYSAAIYLEHTLLYVSSHPQRYVGQTQTEVSLHTVLHRIGFTFAHSPLSCR